MKLQDLVEEYKSWAKKNQPKLNSNEFRIWLFLRMEGTEISPGELRSNLLSLESRGMLEQK
jgi:hypothetical protein